MSLNSDKLVFIDDVFYILNKYNVPYNANAQKELEDAAIEIIREQ